MVLLTFGLLNLWNGNNTVGFWLYDKFNWLEWLMTMVMDVSGGGGIGPPSGERSPRLTEPILYLEPAYTK